MIRFNRQGIMIIPVPERATTGKKELVVVKECYCQAGHSLMSSKAKFGAFNGIVPGIDHKGKFGLIALSPVYGDKSRICLDMELQEGELLTLVCPECRLKLPVYASCSCGGDLVVMFTGEQADFQNCIGICNRVGCEHAEIKNEGQLMTLITGNTII